MMMKLKLWIFFGICFITASLSAQINDSQNHQTLDEKVKENQELLMTDPDKAFYQIDELMVMIKLVDLPLSWKRKSDYQ